MQSWLEVLAALARAQAAEGIVPTEAAAAIGEQARVELLDLELVAEQTRLTGHSTLGLIRALGKGAAGRRCTEHIYVGATVQDLSDTWTSLALRAVGGEVWRDLRRVEELLLDLPEQHRDTVLAGRTHGQPGAPVTFGWKAAGWADEVRRHLDRLREGAPRWLVGQLGGGVGTLAGQGPAGLDGSPTFLRRAGPGRPRASPGWRRAIASRRWGRAGDGHGNPCPHRRRGLRAAAAGDRRAARTEPARHGGQHHDAAQTQSRAQ